MNRQTVQLVIVVALVAIAGCAGGMGGQPANESTGDDPSTTDDSSGGTGTAAFYVSDEPNVIDDFEHLNVTITKVGFKKSGESSGDTDAGNGSDDAENESDGDADNESDDTENATDDGDENETEDDWEEQTEGDEEKDQEDGDEEKDDENEEEGGEEKDGGKEGDEKDDGEKGDDWVEYDVDERTVDLTELKGANASMIDEFELPAGDYEKVFIYVSDTEGVLADGSTTRVKLPSNKLQLNTEFTVGNGERVDFVYDIAPHKAGKSGKYILKPVISGSGTGDDVEIRDIDDEKNEKDRGNDKEKGEKQGGSEGGEKAKQQQD